MGGVGGVETTDHHHQIQGFIHEGEHGVLTFLGGVADGVEGEEVVVQLGRTVFAQHGAFEQASDLLGLALQHGGLVGHPQTFEVPIGIEPWRAGFGKPLNEVISVSVAEDVIGDVLGFLQIEHHQVGAGK